MGQLRLKTTTKTKEKQNTQPTNQANKKIPQPTKQKPKSSLLFLIQAEDLNIP